MVNPNDLTDKEKVLLAERLAKGLAPGQTVQQAFSETEIQSIAEEVVNEVRGPDWDERQS